MTNFARLTLAALCLLPPVIALGQPNAHRTMRNYRFAHLEPAEALAIVLELCHEREMCQILQADNESFIQVLASLEQHEKIDAALRAADGPQASVVLTAFLFSDSKGEQKALPPATKKALDDLKVVMPGRSFRLVESAQIRGRGGNASSVLLSGAWLRVHLGRVPQGAKDLAISLNLRDLFETTVRMKLGETIVVGTTKSSEGESVALILTAERAP